MSLAGERALLELLAQINAKLDDLRARQASMGREVRTLLDNLPGMQVLHADDGFKARIEQERLQVRRTSGAAAAGVSALRATQEQEHRPRTGG